MSSVDNRVVRMQFDNAQFEQGVAKSMKTLDMLNEKLQFKEAQKGVSALQVAIAGLEDVNSDVVSKAFKGLDKIATYSTTIVGKIADKIKNEIADSIMEAVKKITSIPDAAINQIKSGGWNRATNIANAQFQIEGLGYSWEKVKEAADYAVTDTAYGLDSAAKAAAQLAASGVDFEKVIDKAGGRDLTQMHKSLRAISGVAAMTNSSYDEIANIFTKIAGTGRLYATELNSISIRGINAAATLAKFLDVTEEDVHDLVKKGLIDFEMFSEAMDEAFGDHAKEANKTFSGSLANMKAALSRIGAIFAQPVLDKTNTFFISVTSQIKKFQKALTETGKYKISDQGLKDIRNAAQAAADAYGYVGAARSEFISKFVKDSTSEYEDSGISHFSQHFAEAWEAGVRAASAIVDHLDFSWFDNIARFLDGIAIKMRNAFDTVTMFFEGTETKIESVAEAMRNTVGITLEDWKYVDEVIKGHFGNMQARWDALDAAMNEPGGGKRIQGYVDQVVAAGWRYENLGWTEEELRKQEELLTKTFEEQTKELSNEEVKFRALYNIVEFVKGAFEGLKTVAKGLLSGIGNIGRAIGEAFLSIAEGFKEGFQGINISETFKGFTESFVKFTAALRPSESAMNLIREATKKVSETISNLITKVISAGGSIASFAADILTGRKALSELTGSANLSPIEQFSVNFLNILSNLKQTVGNVFRFIGKILKSFGTAFKRVFKGSGVSGLLSKFTDGLSSLSDMFVLSEETADKVTAAFELFFKALQKLGGVFATVFGKIMGFFLKKKGIGEIQGQTKTLVKDIVDLSDEVVDVSVNAEKAEGIFSRLKIIFFNIIEKIKAAPGKIKEFFEALKQSEGVQQLSLSLTKLKIVFKNTIDKLLPPAEATLSAFGATAGEVAQDAPSKIVQAFSKVAEGISTAIDGITWFVGKLPEWKDAIEDFFTTVQTGATLTFDTITTKVDNLGNKFGFDKLFKTISDEWDKATEGGETIGEKVSLFAKDVVGTVGGFLETVDWKSMGKVGLLTLTGMNMFKFFGVLSSTETLISNIADIPKNISNLFKGIGKIFESIDKSVGRLTNITILLGLVSAMVELCGALVLIADLPFEKAKDALAVMTIMTGIILGLAKAVELITRNQAYKAVPNNMQKSEFTFAQIQAHIPAIFGAALTIAAIGGALYVLMKAIGDLAVILDSTSAERIGTIMDVLGGLVLMIAGLAAGVMILMGILSFIQAKESMVEKVGKKTKTTTRSTSLELSGLMTAVISLGGFILAVAGSIFLLVKAMEILSTVDIKPAAAAGVFFGFIAVLGLVAILAKESGEVNPKAILSLTLLVAVIAGSMYVLISQISLLAGILTLAQKTGNGESAIIAIVSVLAFVPLLILALSKILSQGYMDPKSVKYTSLTVVALAGAVLAAAFAIKIMVSSWSDVPSDKMPWVFAGVVLGTAMMAGMAYMIAKLTYQLNDWDGKTVLASLAGVAIAVLALAGSIWILANAFKEDFDKKLASALLGIMLFGGIAAIMVLVTNELKKVETETLITIMASIAGLMLVMSVSVVIIAAAAMILSQAKPLAVIGAIGIFAVMYIAFSSILKKLTSQNLSQKKMEQIADIVTAIGATMLMIAISAMAFARACQMMSSVRISDYAMALIPIVLMLGIFGLIAAKLASTGGAGGTQIVDTLNKVADVFVKIGVAMALMGASVLLLGAGVGLLGGGLGKLAEGIAVLANTFSEHWVTVTILLVIIGLITAAIIYFLKQAAPITEVVGEVAKGVSKAATKTSGTISKVFEGIKNTFSKGTKDAKKWWKELQPKAKMAIATGVVAIVGGLASATPEALKHIGDMIFEILNWLIGLVPKLVGWIVEFLITVLNGLAETIRAKGARIVSAITNVIEALTEIIVHVASAAIIAIANAFGIDISEEIAESAATVITSLRKGQDQIESYAENVNRLTDTTDDFISKNDKLATSLSSTEGKATSFIDTISDLKDTVSGASNTVDSFNLSDVVNLQKMKLPGAADTKMLDILNAKDPIFENAGAGWADAQYGGYTNEWGEMLNSDGSISYDPDTLMADYLNAPEDYAEYADDTSYAYSSSFAQGIDTPTARQEVHDATDNLMGEVEDTIDAHQEEITQVLIPDVMHKLYSSIVANSGEVFRGAQFIVDGVREKLQEAQSLQAVEEAGAELGEHTYWGFKGKKGINANSPSKKFYQGGLYCVQGVANAINQNQDLASNAMISLSDQMIASFSNPLEYAAKMASGEIQYDPTIRPVMDMSSARMGAMNVDSMFRDQSISLTGLSGQIAYDMTNLNGSNAAVVSEIAALREDMDLMTDELMNMQIVMDTGALVGSTVGAYDAALGKRQFYSGRGN